MKTYESKNRKCTIKAYKYNKKFCLQCTHEDGTIVTAQYLTKEQANEQFLKLKKLSKDLVLVK